MSMNELRAVLDGVEGARRRGATAVLATVVRVRGSAYRRPGARMLLLPDGTTVGTVSGGCLEGDVKLRAWRVLDRGEPAVVRYDTTSDGDVVWELGLGCRGVVHVLLERVEPGRPPAHLDFLGRCLRHRRAGVLARVVATRGRVRTGVGACLTLGEGGLAHDFAEAGLADAVARDARDALAEGRSRDAAYELPTGRAEVFLEAVQPPLPLLVCGAGHDALPLVRLAKELGWHVTVLDSRPTYATRARFPRADDIRVAAPEDLQQLLAPDNTSSTRNGRHPLHTLPSSPDWPADDAPEPLALSPRGAAVVMTHNYHNDLHLLRALLPSPLRYVGVLGPRSRTDRLLDELAADGFVPTQGQRARLYAPVGLDLGADAPEEIALAVVAEIQAALAGRGGGFLRHRDGPLHERAEGEADTCERGRGCPAGVS